MTVMLALLCSAIASAQYSYSSASRLDSIENAISSANARVAELRADSVHTAIWKLNASFDIGYSANSTSTDIYKKRNAKFGIFLGFNQSYLFPRRSAWGNMVKVGLNVRWLDLDFSMYDKFTRPIDYTNSNSTGNYYGWVSEMGTTTNPDAPNYAQFSQMSLLAGLFGIGPIVTVAPLSFMNNPASALKVSLYFHYQPTFGLNAYRCGLLRSTGENPLDGVEMGEKELKCEMGYVSLMDFGFRIQWRNFGFGVEGRWGSGKLHAENYYPYYYNAGSASEINISGVSEGKSTYTRKYGQTRVYLNFSF